MSYTMWIYDNKELKPEDIPENSLGFIYKIVNIATGKWYIGRKMLTKAASKMVKGKKKKIRKESDWADYWSSSPALLADIELLGKDKFTREIILFVFTKASLTYSEEFCLFKTGALFDSNCYNGNIRAKIMKSWFAKTPDLHNILTKLPL